MDYSKCTEYTMVEPAFKLRPGTVVTAEITHTTGTNVGWDSVQPYSLVVDGFVVPKSVKLDHDLATLTTLNYDGTRTTVTFQAGNVGWVSGIIHVYHKTVRTVTTVSAINETSTAHYKDFDLVNGTVVPKTVIPFGSVDGTITAVNIVVTNTNNGIDYIDDKPITLTRQGMVEYDNRYVHLLRKGIQYVWVPADFTGPCESQRGNQKLIKIDNQEWQTGYTEARGLLVYNSNLLVSTDAGLCVFDLYGDLATPLLADPRVLGYDLTYFPDDTIGITTGSSILRYRLRHDTALIDKENKRIYFREARPRVEIME